MKIIPPHLTPSDKMFKPYAKYFKEQIEKIGVDTDKGAKLLAHIKETQPEIYRYVTAVPQEIDKGIQEKLKCMLASTGYKK